MWSNWRNHSPLLEMQNNTATSENNSAVFQNVKIRVTIWSSSSTHRDKPKRNKNNHTTTYVLMCTVALFIIAKNGSSLNAHQLMNQWTKCDMSLRQENYSAIRRNEVLIHAATWMKLENLRSNERRQSGKDAYCMTLFI